MGGEGIEKLFEEMGLSMEGVRFCASLDHSLFRRLTDRVFQNRRFTPSCWLGI